MSNINWESCPEATHFDPVDQNFLREVDEALLLFNNKRGWTVPIHTAYGPRIADCLRPLIKRPDWNGKGLPSPDTACELRAKSALGDWSKANIKFASRNVVVWDWDGEPTVNGLCTAYAHAVEMRPIRTPEQIAAEEREKAEDEMYGLTETSCNPEVVRAQRAVCSVLYAAGYRKQEAP